MDVSAISFEQTGLDYFEKAQRPPAIGVEPDIFTAPAPLIVVFLPFAILLDLKKQLSASLLRFLSHYLPAIPSLCE